MTGFRRYAIFHAPPEGGALADFGARWLGWDPARGRRRAHPPSPDPAVAVSEVTRTPRRYGFHATLKPPFRTAAPRAELDAAVAALAARTAPFDAPPLALRRLGRFLALVPSAPCARLDALAHACVSGLDAFRAPASEEELARRRAAGLTPRQEEMLRRWGYPYAGEEFRFHMTLTGSLDPDEAEAVERVLAAMTAPLTAAPTPVRDICLFGEAQDGFFHVVRRFALAG